MKKHRSVDTDSTRPEPKATTSVPPLSRPFLVDRLRRADVEITIEADARERAELARLNGLLGIGRLTGRFRIVRAGAEDVHVSGEVGADVVQTCVVSLEPFAAAVRELVDLHFASEAESAAAQAAAVRSDDDDIDLAQTSDPPDPIIDGRIDFGLIVAEFLTFSLDPYPRKPGATFEGAEAGGGAATASPFAALERLKDSNG